MRSFRAGVAGTFLAALLVGLVPGCDSGGSSGLEAVPDTAKQVKPSDMPSYDPAQDKSKPQKNAPKQ